MKQSNPEQNETQIVDSEAVVSKKTKKGRRGVKRVVVILLIALGAYLAYSVASLYLTSDKNIRQVYLVPQDAAIIIQASEPVKDWKKFSGSPSWQTLKHAETFAEMTEAADMLDSVMHENKVLLSMVGKRDLTISLHKVKANKWDFLIIADMQKMSKVDVLKEQIEQILKLTGYTVTQRVYNGVNIIEMRDPQTKDVMYMAFVDNHFAASYTPALLHAAIDERGKPVIGLEESYMNVEKLVEGKGLCRIYINYKYLPGFLGIYLGGSNEYIDMFSKSMDYAGLYFNTEKDRMEAKGYTLLRDEASPYVTALLKSGKHKMKAHEIMSARTAMYANIGFENPSTFVKELEFALSESDKAAFDSYKAARKKIEGYFGISLDQNFLSWMSGEFAFSQSEPGLLGREAEIVLAIRASDIKDARENMELLEKRIRRRTPLKMKAVEYKGYTINYVEMNGFFRLFFGGLFDSFEKPYYTYIGDYVVFSNKSASILSLIEDYEQKNLMKDDEGFRSVLSRASGQSTLFTYIDMPKYYPLLLQMVTPAVKTDLQANRDILYSFPRWMVQVVGDEAQPSMHFMMEYKPYQEPEIIEADSVDVEEVDEEQSERELMNELKRFYVEKFEGNVLREFYPGGALKSETETRSGVRYGRHREYYESGKLKLRGKYANNKPKGVWKYYTEDGKFERKERF